MSLKQEQNELWEQLREDGEMLADFFARKIGMPHATSFSVAIPVEIDGVFVMVDLDTEQVPRLITGLIDALPEAIAMEAKATSEYATFEAIKKAMGQ